MAEVSTEPLLALVDAFAALPGKEYPDVYANPPVPLETLRQHAEELRVAEEAVKRDQAAEAAATKALDERLRALGRGPGEAEAVVALRNSRTRRRRTAPRTPNRRGAHQGREAAVSDGVGGCGTRASPVPRLSSAWREDIVPPMIRAGENRGALLSHG